MSVQHFVLFFTWKNTKLILFIIFSMIFINCKFVWNLFTRKIDIEFEVLIEK